MKKGFTLIELLAVIVILAIIAIIAVPTITKVVDKAKKGAVESSALNYIDAVEKYIMLHDVNPTKYPYDLKNGTFNVAESTEVSLLDIIVPKAKAEETIPALNSFITVKGDKPTSGTVTTNTKGKVTEAILTIRGYNITCDSDSCTAAGGGSSTPQITLSIDETESTTIYINEPVTLTATTNSSDGVTWQSSDDTTATISSEGVVIGVKPGNVTITASIGSVEDTIDLTIISGATIDLSPFYTHKSNGDNYRQQLSVIGRAYLNPSSGHIYDKCDAEHASVGSGTGGCMKWYIYGQTDTHYKLLLDHNTSNSVVWDSSWSNNNQTAVSYANNSGALIAINSLQWDSNITEKRIMDYSELTSIVTILNSGYFQGGQQQGKGASSFSWLFENLNDCERYGCESNSPTESDSAYWIGDVIDGGRVRGVMHAGGVYNGWPANYTDHGVRPVIVVPKNIFNVQEQQ